MLIVAIDQRVGRSSGSAEQLAEVLGVTLYDARQRLTGSGPSVVALLQDLPSAEVVAARLRSAGFRTLVHDPARQGRAYAVRRFSLEGDELWVELVGGKSGRIPFDRIDQLVTVMRVREESTSQTVTEKKFSIGKTLVAGGIPLKSKSEHRETVTSFDSERALYLCSAGKPQLLFSQGGVQYDGLGARMAVSREQNFMALIAVLKERNPALVSDDRLVRRTEQVRLLGPLLSPESHIETAVALLAASNAGRFLS